MRKVITRLSHLPKLLAIAATIVVTPVRAIAQDTQVIQIPAGSLSVSHGRVYINGEEIHRNDHASLFDLGKAGILIESRHGGKTCPQSFLIVHPDTGTLRDLNPEADRSAVFGECHRLERVLPDLGLVIMQPQSGHEQARIFAWNGYRMNLTILRRALDGAEIPGGGAEVERWIGRYMHELTQDPGEQLRLKLILSEEELAEFNFVSNAGSPFERQGGWVVGTACWPTFCEGRWSVLALRISDGAPFVVLSDGTRAMPAGEAMPAILEQVDHQGRLP
jgi:hypothetical protein